MDETESTRDSRNALDRLIRDNKDDLRSTAQSLRAATDNLNDVLGPRKQVLADGIDRLARASADLDSYLVLGKQFLNIGKPFIIEGLGVLEKSQQGDYEFRQGFFHQATSFRSRVPCRQGAKASSLRRRRAPNQC